MSCRTGLDHCHGTVVLHIDAECTDAECTDAECTDVQLLRHTLIIRCDDVEGGCGCQAERYEELGRAS
ncbi:hypothetical protein SacxiDRAFT_1806 [Saccharomonospora xinjiangensis XJ-54]|uniref:Uncharacterized protein n=2 Tax=Saccharomonospora TaxID=1851 RepID=I0V1P5_9PSEU|nr:hypothetical protein SacxiDRAFT_1806 [Saccharomonospora xinjiangensis XJ-54]